MNLSKELMNAVRELVGVIGEDEVQEIEIEQSAWGKSKIRISRVGAQAPVVQAVPQVMPTQAAAPQPVAAAESVPAQEASEADDESGYHTLKSPMVGMFYRSPNPEAPAYVQDGDAVDEGQTLCIIEAMKIMNEIEADVKGRVVRVLVENATPVEYNTPPVSHRSAGLISCPTTAVFLPLAILCVGFPLFHAPI